MIPVSNSATVIRPDQIRGTISIPGDKSITHRALIFNAMARGEAKIQSFLDAQDTRSTINCLRMLGVEIQEKDPACVVVRGQGRAGLSEPTDVLNCGNSGTTMRLLAGMLSGLPMLTVLSGDASLRQRPMGRIVEPLRALGADLSGRARDTMPPLVIRGRALRGGMQVQTPVASAQVKSALLLAGLASDGPTTVIEPSQSRDHTERMLAAMGATIQAEGTVVTITPPNGDLNSSDITVPGDISTAAPWITAATLHPDAELLLTGVGVNPTRTGLLDVLREMGGDIELLNERTSGGEAVADIRVRSAKLRGIEVGGDLIPRAIDELPLVALAGAVAEGETLIRDAAELRVKESDRVATTVKVLGALGVELEPKPDGMTVQGEANLSGAHVDSSGDHRLAMLGAVAGLLANGETVVGNANAVSVSYPAFWTEVSRLGAAPGLASR